MKNCPKCNEPVTKCLLFGLPMWLCLECRTGGGFASFLFPLSNGVLFSYEGSYWSALWRWVCGH